MSSLLAFVINLGNLFFSYFIYVSMRNMWELDFLPELSFVQFWGMYFIIGIFSVHSSVYLLTRKEDADKKNVSLETAVSTTFALSLIWVISWLVTFVFV